MCLDATRIAGGAAGTCGGTTERWTAKNKCSTDQVPLRNMSIFGAIHCLFLDTHLWKEFFFFVGIEKKALGSSVQRKQVLQIEVESIVFHKSF